MTILTKPDIYKKKLGKIFNKQKFILDKANKIKRKAENRGNKK